MVTIRSVVFFSLYRIRADIFKCRVADTVEWRKQKRKGRGKSTLLSAAGFHHVLDQDTPSQRRRRYVLHLLPFSGAVDSRTGRYAAVREGTAGTGIRRETVLRPTVRQRATAPRRIPSFFCLLLRCPSAVWEEVPLFSGRSCLHSAFYFGTFVQVQ